MGANPGRQSADPLRHVSTRQANMCEWKFDCETWIQGSRRRGERKSPSAGGVGEREADGGIDPTRLGGQWGTDKDREAGSEATAETPQNIQQDEEH